MCAGGLCLLFENAKGERLRSGSGKWLIMSGWSSGRVYEWFVSSATFLHKMRLAKGVKIAALPFFDL